MEVRLGETQQTTSKALRPSAQAGGLFDCPDSYGCPGNFGGAGSTGGDEQEAAAEQRHEGQHL
jgi:hypothetical protein